MGIILRWDMLEINFLENDSQRYLGVNGVDF